jgi:hypothetical protein
VEFLQRADQRGILLNKLSLLLELAQMVYLSSIAELLSY